MRFIGNDPNILDAFYKATASGSIAAGKPVMVTAPEDQQGSESSAFDVQAHYLSAVYDTSNDKVVVAYSDPGDSNYGKVVVGTVSGSDVTFGTPVVFESDTVTGNYSITSAFDSANNKVVIAYRDGGNSNEGTAIVGTVSGTSISFGSAVVFETGETYDLTATFDDVAEKVVIAYRDVSNSQYGTAIVGTVSGTSISFGTATVFESAATEYIFALAMPNWNNTSERRILIAYSDGGNGGGLTLITGTVSGTGISFGSARLADASLSYNPVMALMTSGDGINRAVCAYKDDGSSGNGKAFTVRAIDTTNNNESAYTFDSGNNSFSFPSAVYDASQQKVLLVYRDQSNSNQGEYVYATPSANGEALTFTTPALFFENLVSGVGQSIAAVYDPDSEKAVVAYRKPDLSGAAKTIFNDPGGKVKAIASVSASAGTSTLFHDASTGDLDVVYDSTAQKIVVFYQDIANSSYPTAQVGTVSGTSVSFGTATVIESQSGDGFSATFDSNAGKIVVAYRQSSTSGKCAIGTVSGTSISFGTPVVFENASVDNIAIAFDSDENRIVIAYRDRGNSNQGTAIAGSVSGTSISFGSASVFQSGSVTGGYGATYDATAQKVVIGFRYNSQGKAIVVDVNNTTLTYGTAVDFTSNNAIDISLTYDSTAGKNVFVFRDLTDTDGKAVVGTVTASDNSISFGTVQTFKDNAVDDPRVIYDSSSNNLLIVYEDTSGTTKLSFLTATLSGTTLTFGSSIDIISEDATSPRIAYDANAAKHVVVYSASAASDKGKYAVLTNSSTNLTSENYIGITDQAYTDGQDATVAVVGCIDRNQTSLTAGQQYFVQTDGTFSTTAGSPSVLAGTAISATELVVKE